MALLHGRETSYDNEQHACLGGGEARGRSFVGGCAGTTIQVDSLHIEGTLTFDGAGTYEESLTNASELVLTRQ